jgi:hypothetical protein
MTKIDQKPSEMAAAAERELITQTALDYVKGCALWRPT